MKDETGLPIRCTVVDPHVENGGRDDWKAEIASAFPDLFEPPRGLPECGGGWRYLIEDACARIREALEADQDNTLKMVQINQKAGVLNMFWEGTLSARARTKVERAIEQAYIESARTCEVCGFEGRLYTCAGWLTTACTGHGKGKVAPWERRVETVRIVQGTMAGKPQILSCRQYDPEDDCFFDVAFDSLEIGTQETLSQEGSQRHPGPARGGFWLKTGRSS